MRRARGARDAAGVFSLTTGGPRAAEGACPASGETAPWGNAETGHRVRGRGRRVVRAERAARSNVDETRASGNAGLGADLGARRAVRARRGGREKRGPRPAGQQRQRSRRRQSGKARGLGRTSPAGHGFIVVVLALVGDVVGIVGVALDVLARGAVGRGAAIVRPREGRALDYLLPVLAPAVSIVDAGHGVRMGKAVGAKVPVSATRARECCDGVRRGGGWVRPACGARRGVRNKSRQVACGDNSSVVRLPSDERTRGG